MNNENSSGVTISSNFSNKNDYDITTAQTSASGGFSNKRSPRASDHFGAGDSKHFYRQKTSGIYLKQGEGMKIPSSTVMGSFFGINEEEEYVY